MIAMLQQRERQGKQMEQSIATATRASEDEDGEMGGRRRRGLKPMVRVVIGEQRVCSYHGGRRSGPEPAVRDDRIR
jgi:hypothetical protein